MSAPQAANRPEALTLQSPSGLRAVFNANGSLRRMEHAGIAINLFVGNELEGGPTNLYLRRLGAAVEVMPLLGPLAPAALQLDAAGHGATASGRWRELGYTLRFVLAAGAPAWYWHLALENLGSEPIEADVVLAHDLALAPYGAVRLNEYYVSQYVDHAPLAHARVGRVIASRQNQAAGGRYPWSVIGSLREGTGFATDARQLHGLASRAGAAWPQALGTPAGLPSQRLQHEHSMVAIQDAPLTLAPHAPQALGFFGHLVADHPAASGPDDLAWVERALAQPEAALVLPEGTEPREARGTPDAPNGARPGASLFASAPHLAALDLDAAAIDAHFGSARRHEERDEAGRLLSFFHGEARHAVLRAKELQVLRPHGQLLRSGRAALPDESALASTAWMTGVFHSMLTQGHVSINRCLSTVHGYLGLFRSHGQRVFVEIDGAWRLLDLPSAFEMAPEACRWLYRHAGGTIEVRSAAHDAPHAMSLSVEVLDGPPLRCLVSHHVALNGDDGSTPGAPAWESGKEGGKDGGKDGGEDGVSVRPAPGSELARRFPAGRLRMVPEPGTRFEQVGGDELLYDDAGSRGEPLVCLVTAAGRRTALRLVCEFVDGGPDVPASDAPAGALRTTLRVVAPASSALAAPLERLGEIVPWFLQNALVHYLAPRGLEQYSGGGWGTRDVCQGPVEMLLALDGGASVRELLLRVMAAQRPDGDWPQWFMFFERERTIRAGDSHGDIVFWPVLALAQYLIATGDASILDEPVPFFRERRSAREARPSVWQHAQRALKLIRERVVAGTALAAYGHGDWNDALQPADPALREHMCSAWTVTLHHQTLATLARALRGLGRTRDAAALERQRDAVRADFQRLLLVDGVLAGYAVFEGGGVRYLLHPRDDRTGVRYSVLAMIHAILEDLLSPAQAREHLALIDAHLVGPDGVHLFDRPMPYHGGPQRLFQRAESASFFGREIGLMYMHAHLRYAQALAHVGDAAGFFRALCQANPIGLRALVPSAAPRQVNCYYSSSDPAFPDRYAASEEYARVAAGTIALDGGWRVYSSGAGIALGLLVRRFLGLDVEAHTLRLDPVIPNGLDGLRVETLLRGRPLEVSYAIGARGCGVEAVTLDGEALPFDAESNPHRRGAARVPLAPLLERLDAGARRLQLRLG